MKRVLATLALTVGLFTVGFAGTAHASLSGCHAFYANYAFAYCNFYDGQGYNRVRVRGTCKGPTGATWYSYGAYMPVNVNSVAECGSGNQEIGATYQLTQI